MGEVAHHARCDSPIPSSWYCGAVGCKQRFSGFWHFFSGDSGMHAASADDANSCGVSSSVETGDRHGTVDIDLIALSDSSGGPDARAREGSAGVCADMRFSADFFGDAAEVREKVSRFRHPKSAVFSHSSGKWIGAFILAIPPAEVRPGVLTNKHILTCRCYGPDRCQRVS
jgi:hypothetical protein